MNTLKSAALVVVLAGVLVAVYVTVYQPPVAPPPGMTQQEVDDLGPPLIEEDAAHEEAIELANVVIWHVNMLVSKVDKLGPVLVVV